MLLAAIIGISLVSYIKLSNNSLRQAHRTFYSNSAMNLAEIGLEEAIACFNQIDNVATPNLAWTGTNWGTPNTTPYNATTSPNTPYVTGRFTGFDVGPNTTGSVQVYVQHHEGSAAQNPIIVAKSTITLPDGQPISKYIEVTLRKRSLFANGLVARENVTWVGQPMADSYDSHADTKSPADAYNPANRTANVVVGSISGNIGLAGGEVWGYAKTGEFGTITGGSVHPLGTTTDDPTRRTNDFNATFPEPTVPNPNSSDLNIVTTNINTPTTLPAAGDKSVTVAGKEVFYYKFNSGKGVNTAGSELLTIQANKNVVFLMQDHSGVDAITTTGTSGIKINAGASLNVYTNGNIKIAGSGMANSNNNPASFMVWGTNTTSQTVDISGNGQLNAVVYAPNATVDLNGGGASGLMCGAVVAKTIKMNGGTEFHYDDALGRLTTGNPYGISKWRELQSATERAAYEAKLAL
jgi:hypothetical protein